MMTSNNREIAPPIPTADSLPFWQAANNNQFLIKRCVDCNKVHWHPRPVCPFCFSSHTQWQNGSGLGSVYSFSIMRHSGDPFVVAYITLDEGPTMLSNVIECDPEKLAIGQKVQVKFMATTGDYKVPMFTPIN